MKNIITEALKSKRKSILWKLKISDFHILKSISFQKDMNDDINSNNNTYKINNWIDFQV